MSQGSGPDRAGARPSARAAELRARIAQLHVEASGLREQMLRVKAEYEAGRLSLDEELSQIRALERQLVAIGVRIHDLASEPT